jgi:hypothetical protein
LCFRWRAVLCTLPLARCMIVRCSTQLFGGGALVHRVGAETAHRAGTRILGEHARRDLSARLAHAAKTSSRYHDWTDTGGYAHTELHRQPRAHQHCMRAPQHARARHALLRWRYLLRLRSPIITTRPSASFCSFAVFVLRPNRAPLRFLAAVVELMRATQIQIRTRTHTHARMATHLP